MFWVIAAAFAIAVLSGMGVGSGGLFVVFLTMLCDVPQIRAQGLNLVFFLFSSGGSMIVHLMRRTLPFSYIAILTVCGLLAAVPGSYAALVLPEALVRKLFGTMLVLSGGAGLLRSKKKKLPAAKKYL